MVVSDHTHLLVASSRDLGNYGPGLIPDRQIGAVNLALMISDDRFYWMKETQQIRKSNLHRVNLFPKMKDTNQSAICLQHFWCKSIFHKS